MIGVLGSKACEQLVAPGNRVWVRIPWQPSPVDTGALGEITRSRASCEVELVLVHSEPLMDDTENGVVRILSIRVTKLHDAQICCSAVPWNEQQ